LTAFSLKGRRTLDVGLRKSVESSDLRFDVHDILQRTT